MLSRRSSSVATAFLTTVAVVTHACDTEPRVPRWPKYRSDTLAVSFAVVRQWSDASRGYGAIVIDSAHHNEADLRTLGEELRIITDGEQYAFITVYGNDEAAKLWTAAAHDSLSEEQSAFYDKNWLGQYIRNHGVRFHHFTITPHGRRGPEIKVEYRPTEW